MVIQRQPQPLIVFPIHILWGFALLNHSNAIGNGAHEFAEVAAYAFFFFDGVGVVWIAIFKGMDWWLVSSQAM